MEVPMWDKVVLLWVKGCNFIESDLMSVEDANFEMFMSKYVMHVRFSERYLKDNRVLCSKYNLADYFPFFEPQLDKNGCVHRKDYILIYSLLLYQTTSRTPTAYYLDVLSKLPGPVRRFIDLFGQRIRQEHYKTREVILKVVGSLWVDHGSGFLAKCIRTHLVKQSVQYARGTRSTRSTVPEPLAAESRKRLELLYQDTLIKRDELAESMLELEKLRKKQEEKLENARKKAEEELIKAHKKAYKKFNDERKKALDKLNVRRKKALDQLNIFKKKELKRLKSEQD